MGIRLFIFFICSTVFVNLKSQEEALSIELRALIEERLEFLTTEQIDRNADYTAQFDFLEQALLDPIKLNKADAEELRNLQLLTEIQIKDLIVHREKHGKLLAYEELLSISSFDASTIRLIRPFCSLTQAEHYPNPSFAMLKSEGRSNFFLRHSRTLQKSAGYREKDGYLGSVDQLYSRFRYQYNRRLSIGFSAEKDAGEEFFKGSQKNGFDFYSAHLFIQDWKGFEKIAFGDFQLQVGQGLTYWSGLAFSGGMGVAGLKRAGQGLRPYTSVQENSFLRGCGFERKFGKLSLTSFLSSNSIDGRSILVNNRKFISGFPGNGLHRTPSELERKKQLKEQQGGAHLQYHDHKMEIGFTAVGRKLSLPPLASSQLYRKFSQDQILQFNLGLDYSFYLSNLLLFGETARSMNAGMASLNGLLWAGSRGFQIGLLHRYYQRDYRAIQSNALGSNAGNYNERGLYWKMESPLGRRLKLIVNYDLFRFPWLRFQVDAPSKGVDRLAELRYFPKRDLELYFRYRERMRERNSRASIGGVDQIMIEESRNYRFHLKYQLSENFRWQSRIEWRSYQFENLNENGLLVYQDLSFKSLNSPFSFSLRMAVFDCPTYDSRIYAYERDVLYAFSIPAYYGVGSRFYLLIQWKVKKGIDLWFRYAQTSYQDRNLMGSGRDEILGNQRSQIKTQLRLSF
jgi:hypothetical protein